MYPYAVVAIVLALLVQGCARPQMPIVGAGGGLNHAASIRASPETGEVPLEVTLVGQLNPPDTEATYAWSFGDGAHAQGSRIGHTYERADSFEVRLTVTDRRGRISIASTRIDAHPVFSPWDLYAQASRWIVLRGIEW
jgi:hypothetical protein